MDVHTHTHKHTLLTHSSPVTTSKLNLVGFFGLTGRAELEGQLQSFGFHFGRLSDVWPLPFRFQPFHADYPCVQELRSIWPGRGKCGAACVIP